jgi:ribosome-binding factor A
MLAGKRSVRVGDQILKEMADLLMKRVKDPRVKGTTLTSIHLSNDLKHARVFYSVMGEREEILTVQAGLDSAKGFIKREIGQRMDLKYVPDIVFKHDPSLEKGNHMEKLFMRIKGDESNQPGE